MMELLMMTALVGVVGIAAGALIVLVASFVLALPRRR